MSMVQRGGHGAEEEGSKDHHLPPAPSPVGSKALAHAYKRGLPTPSPLRRMEDPCADHIMPSRNDKRRKEKNALMLPPAIPPSRTRRKTQPQVLDEDTFVDAMGEIIERDFFPELPRLHRQVKWLEALEAHRLRSLTEVRRVVQSEMRRDTFAAGGGDGGFEGGASSSFSSAASTPVNRGGQRHHIAGSDTPVSTSNSSESSPSPLPLSLDQFLALFQSEDDAAFDVLAERMREAHRRKYWWIYSHPQLEAGKEKLYLLPNGEMMTEEERRKHVAAANAKPRLGDDRPNAPDTWPSRPQNNFIFFPGSLEENAKVHQGGANAATQPQLLQLEQGGGEGARMLTAGAGGAGNNTRVGQEAKAPKRLMHSNTRFSTTQLLEWKGGRTVGRASPLERLASELSTLSSESAFSTSTQDTQAQAMEGFVPMTPLLVPGMGGNAPIVTWGEIGSTPLRVKEPFDYGGGGGGGGGEGGGGGREGERKRFEIQGPTFREKVAGELEAKARARGGKTREGRSEWGGGGGRSADGVYASLSGGKKGGESRRSYLTNSSSSSSSKKRGLGSLTPAAQSLAAKLAASAGRGRGGGGGGGGGDAFGGGASSQLRATYAGSVGTVGGRGSSRRVVGSSILTPTPSPLRALPKRSSKKGVHGDGERRGGGSGGSAGGEEVEEEEEEGGGGGGGGGGDEDVTPSAGAMGGKRGSGWSKVTENLLNF